MPISILGKRFSPRGTVVPTSGQIHHWPFNNSLNDNVGNIDAQVVGGTATYNTDSVLGDASIEGASGIDGVKLLDDTDITTNEYAISIWFKSNNTNGDSQARIISRDRSEYFALTINQSTPFPQNLDVDVNGASNYSAGSFVQNDVWHNLILNFDDSGTLDTEIYLDGTLETIRNANGSAASRPIALFTNVEPGVDGTRKYNGLIDEVRFYDRYLTTQEVQDIYDNGTQTSGGGGGGNGGSGGTPGTPVTQGFTQDALWDDINTDYGDLSSTQECSFRVDVDHTDGEEGIIWETGGTGAGACLYVYQGTLYFQGGNGGNFGSAAAGRVEMSWPITTGQYILEVSYSASGNTAALYVDGDLKDSDTASSLGRIGGSNAGGIGKIHEALCVTRGAQIPYEGSITNGAFIYTNETTDDV